MAMVKALPEYSLNSGLGSREDSHLEHYSVSELC